MGETTPSASHSSCANGSGNNNSLPGSSHVSFSWTGASGCRGASEPSAESPPSSSKGEDTVVTRPSSPDWSSQLASATRVRFTYQDEATRARICKNAQALVEGLQRDRASTTVNAQVARKALRYRRLMDRFSDLDPDSTSVDISAFLGIEWHRIEAQASAGSSDTSETSSSSIINDEERGEKSESPIYATENL